jgi:signal transduction histidine kinase
LQNSLDDSERLQTLVEDILLAARFEDEGYRFASDVFDLSELVDEVVLERTARAGGSHAFESRVAPAVTMTGDRQAVGLVVSNLIDNAVKYAPAGSSVRVTLETREQRALIAVEDAGPGVPKAERKKIFRRFYRIGNEDTRKSKGTGLGLFIVRQIVRRHRGDVRVLDRPGGGARFEVTVRLN